ncbi:odorant receptor 131-2-like [Pempheris klunzingeri]|uniref:odorant receptor 131-2-like n=1 Tax=Pempheris klunzingeri TaxID=3127111 RepID=UPI00397FF04F
MSKSNESQTNVSVELQYQSLVERLVFSSVTTLPCCVFLFINVTMLFTLRSKVVFRETSRYVLLFNLLLADTVLLIQSQLLYLLSACRIMLMYPVCGLLTMLADLNTLVSPLTLVVMSLERYVAVCYPLRHAAVVTIRNTSVAVAVLWASNSLKVLVQVVLMSNFSFKDPQSLQMTDFCGKDDIFLYPASDLHDKAYTYFVFVSAGVAVSCSYVGVTAAARSASTDRASARKARNTLLLHLVQLSLSLSSTVHNPLLIAISQVLDRIVLVRVQIVLYVSVIILPRCLSSLIYGFRDQTIRPALMCNLCCQWRSSVSPPAETKISVHISSYYS